MKFHKVFVDFSTFSDVFERVRTRSDAFGRNRMHFGALGCVRTLAEKFKFFRKFCGLFGQFGDQGVYFSGSFTCKGCTFLGVYF